ncbi:hypothetical protein CON94_28385 [Bacillus pseudomycoides]|uniref:DUF2971 domain-containing protein n=1 Tax=Bacillus pseudomycoides TaxID=64104 RepID=UPI000BEDC01C|nr:DUF2971 domain-containing protein [Bacillus pseudomycoides]PEF72085.1 hypothetical protein CON94_28385 [Bacillus pseudomycoides]PEL85494.1 hypothetical protein CN615_17995 [Bacillus pseudomycoides]PHC77461.1 hypothetical protein COF38_08530 [Bacillus pseudomycoides]
MGVLETNRSIVTTSDDTKIWRYMSFEKFVSLLENESLYFVRSNKFPDKFEGVLPKKIQDEIFKPDRYWQETNEKNKKLYREHRESIVVNCWHINEHESAAMWDLYLNSSDGVAIQSTVSSFKKSVEETKEKIYMGKITYLDYQNDDPNFDDEYSQYMHKRKSFEHEKELRFIHDLNNRFFNNNKPETENINLPDDMGLSIQCDIKCLIEKIYVSPKSAKWFENLVRAICNKYGLEKEVFKSRLYDEALY